MKEYLVFFKKIGFKACFLLLVNFLFYRLKYINNRDSSGYYLVKRKWLWFVMTPIFLPVYMIPIILAAIVGYFEFIFNYWSHWISDHDQKLSLKKRIVYRRQLW